jgi:hypothetical protein
MKKIILLGFTMGFAAALLAQGPRGGFGPLGGGFGGPGPGDILGAGPRSRTPVTGEPYSATETLTTQQTLTNGNTISRTQTSTVARDGSGRIYTSETITPPASSGKQPYTISTIYDPVAGYRYLLNSSAATAIQTPLPSSSGTRPGPPAGATPPARPNAPTITKTTLPQSTINGVTATGTAVTETIAAGAIGNAQPIQIVRTTWVSTQLSVPVEIKTSDPRYGTTDMELTNIVQSAPDASLFVVPAGYTVTQGGRGGPGPGGPGGPGGPRGRRPVGN